ncbi:MAG: HyaD/HybD family hydrogenase maturation endopeptidase, partial [Candidatus Thiodiazotropha endolucinida]|nr:HyaD/HybD family hydrogenase maturation endopeptidase [Candidatus Thiodiazotropha taylori]MCW4240607.1 HyaD/HybD family hydrogenase maturation endopeptidase [Candidatus Thiodiazotropha taylori]
PVELEDYGGSLRPKVREQIEPAIDLVLSYLKDFAIQAERRDQPLTPDTLVQGAISDMQTYEAERPSDESACRAGDARVLQSDAFDLAYRPVDIQGGAVSVDVDAHLDKYRQGESD